MNVVRMKKPGPAEGFFLRFREQPVQTHSVGICYRWAAIEKCAGMGTAVIVSGWGRRGLMRRDGGSFFKFFSSIYFQDNEIFFPTAAKQADTSV